MNKMEDIDKILPAVLEMTDIQFGEYVIVGSAAEFIAGFSKKFRDIDVWVSPEVFKKAMDKGFEYETKWGTRVINVGCVEIVETDGTILSKPFRKGYSHPILNDIDMIEWRMELGRPKDKVRAWEMAHHAYAGVRESLLNPQMRSVQDCARTVEKDIFELQQRLIKLP